MSKTASNLARLGIEEIDQCSSKRAVRRTNLRKFSWNISEFST